MATAEVIAQAKEKIAKEVNEYEDLKRENGAAVIMTTDERNPFKEYLFQRIDTVEGFAEKVLLKDKSIMKGLAWSANKIPQKVKALKMVQISTEDVFSMICEYFDWDEEAERLKKEAARKKKEEKMKAKASSVSDGFSDGDDDSDFKYEEYMAKVKKEREEAEARRKAEEAEKLAKKQAEEERKKRERLGICEGQMDIFGLCGISEPAPVEEEQPQEAPKSPVSIIRPVEHPVIEHPETLVVPVKEDIVVEVDDDPLLPFSLELNPLEDKAPEPVVEEEEPDSYEEADIPEPQSEETEHEEVAEEDVYDLLGF